MGEFAGAKDRNLSCLISPKSRNVNRDRAINPPPAHYYSFVAVGYRSQLRNPWNWQILAPFLFASRRDILALGLGVTAPIRGAGL